MPVIGQTKATPIRRILKVTHHEADPRAKRDVCNCLVSEEFLYVKDE